jgi:Domain of unknown function (DUF4402)
MKVRVASLGLGLIAATAFAVSPPARAQCRLCSTPTTSAGAIKPGSSVALEVEAGLDFDRLIVLGPSGGSAVLRPDGSRQTSGSIEAIGARAMVGEARVRGEPGRAIRIDLPRRIELFSIHGSQIIIDEIETDLPSLPRLDSAGSLSFRFGGRLQVNGEQEGDFRGDLPITAEYL